MSIADEIKALDDLKKSGALSEEEFQQAKMKLLRDESPPSNAPNRSENTLGSAANRYVSFQMIMAVVGIILFLIFFLAFFLPMFRQHAHM